MCAKALSSIFGKPKQATPPPPPAVAAPTRTEGTVDTGAVVLNTSTGNGGRETSGRVKLGKTSRGGSGASVGLTI